MRPSPADTAASIVVTPLYLFAGEELRLRISGTAEVKERAVRRSTAYDFRRSTPSGTFFFSFFFFDFFLFMFFFFPIKNFFFFFTVSFWAKKKKMEKFFTRPFSHVHFRQEHWQAHALTGGGRTTLVYVRSF